jgi:hypothetical protein
MTIKFLFDVLAYTSLIVGSLPTLICVVAFFYRLFGERKLSVYHKELIYLTMVVWPIVYLKLCP